MNFYQRVTHAFPERCAYLPDPETGRTIHARIPQHATRPARPWELGWHEPCEAGTPGAVTKAEVWGRWDDVPSDVRRQMREATERVEEGERAGVERRTACRSR